MGAFSDCALQACAALFGTNEWSLRQFQWLLRRRLVIKFYLTRMGVMKNWPIASKSMAGREPQPRTPVTPWQFMRQFMTVIFEVVLLQSSAS